MADIFSILLTELKDFFGIGAWLEMFTTGDYSRLNTLNGILGAISPLIPLLIVLEFISAIIQGRLSKKDYKNTMLIYVINRIIGRFISIGLVSFCIGFFQPFAIFKTHITW